MVHKVLSEKISGLRAENSDLGTKTEPYDHLRSAINNNLNLDRKSHFNLRDNTKVY